MMVKCLWLKAKALYYLAYHWEAMLPEFGKIIERSQTSFLPQHIQNYSKKLLNLNQFCFFLILIIKNFPRVW
jgi:hypothetical protein